MSRQRGYRAPALIRTDRKTSSSHIREEEASSDLSEKVLRGKRLFLT